MPFHGFGHVAVSANGYVYAIGGWDNDLSAYVGTAYAYDPTGNSWTTKTSMPTARYAAGAAVAGGKVYVVGGDDGLTEMSVLEEYDPGTDTWTTKAPMPTPRTDLVAVAVGGTVYAIGGRDAFFTILYPTVEAYDPNTDTWVTKASLGSGRAALAGVELGGLVYAIGGFDGASMLDSVAVYDPAADNWTGGNSLPVPRMGASAAVVNGRIFLMGGIEDFSSVPMATVFAFDPVASTWTTADPMITARQALAAAVLNSKIYATGGGDNSTVTAFDVNEVGVFRGVSLAMSVDPSATVVGHWFTVTLTVTNDGGADLTSAVPELSPDSAIAEPIDGPIPAGPVTIQAFSSTVFVWTWSASGLGLTTFTATVSGTDSDSLGTVTGSTTQGFTGLAPAKLETALSFVPDPAGYGRWFEARLTASNTGGVPADGVSPGIQVNGGTGTIEPIAGPVPAGPVAIPGGGMTVFVWTFSVSGAGGVELTATATGTESSSGNPLESASTGVATTVPAVVFTSSLAVSPDAAMPAQPVEIVLTVTNVGTADANNVIPAIDINTGAGNLTYVSGPLPAGPLTIAAGTAQSFTWSYVAGAGILATFTATASGVDASLGVPVFAVGSGSLAKASPLDAALAVSPGSVLPGTPVEVVLTVTNTGATDVNGVTPAIQVNSGAGNLVFTSGPSPAGPLVVAAGVSQSFTWQYTAVGSVYASLTATASGVDAVSGNPVIGPASGALVKSAECFDGLVLKALPPSPVYANGGDRQEWGVSFSLAGSTTLYNVTITTQPNSFQARIYAPYPQSFVLNGTTISASAWAADLAGPWTAGPPPPAVGDPLYMRWVVTTLRPGRGGTIKWSTTVLGGAGQIVQTFVSATLSCDAAGTVPAQLYSSATATGERLSPPASWIALWGPPSVAPAQDSAIAASTSASLFAAGWETHAGQGTDWSVRKYGSTGGLVWNASYNGPANGDDAALGVAVDASGSLIVCGVEDRSDLLEGDNWLLRLYDPSGGLTWSRSYNSPGNGDEAAQSVAVGPSGNYVVAGWEDRPDLGQGRDWRLTVYSPSGNPTGTTSYDGPAHGADAAFGVAIDGSSNRIAVGFEDRSDLGQGRNWRIIKYDSAFNILWTRTWNGDANGDDEARAVAVDARGNIVVVGTETSVAGGVDYRAIEYDANGNVVWTRNYNSSGLNADYAMSVSADAGGNVTIAGYEDRPDLGQATNWRFLKLDNAGNVVDSFSHDGLASGSDVLGGVAVIPGTQDAGVAGSESLPDNTQAAAVARLALAGFNPPRPASGLTAVASGGAITLSWASPGGGTRALSGYRIYRTTSASVAVVSENWYVDVYGAGSLSFVDTGVTNGLRYRYKLIPVDDQGASATSSATANAMLEAAFLTAALTVVPDQAVPGQAVSVRCRVKNTGLATAEMVIPDIELNTAALAVTLFAGPTPSGTVSLDPGQARTFVWSYSVAGYGLVTWTASVTGFDTGLGGSLLAAGSATLLSAPVAVIEAALAMPAASSTVLLGQVLTVDLTLTNVGSLEAINLVPSLAFWPPGVLVPLTGPPASLGLPVGSSTVLTWTFSVAGGAVLDVLAGVTGNNGAGGVLTVSRTGSCMLATPGMGWAVIDTSPTIIADGQMFTLRVTITNTGDMPLTDVYVSPNPAIWPYSGSVTLTQASGPVPPGPQLVHGHSATAFTWTFSTTGAGISLAGATIYLTESSYNLPFSGLIAMYVCVMPRGGLTASLAASPLVVQQGGNILVTMTVSTTGIVPVWSVTPTAALAISSTSFARQSGGPSPPLQELVGGCPQANCAMNDSACPRRTFTWTVTALASGFVSFGASVFWTESLSMTVSLTGAISNTVFIQAAPSLASSASVSPAAMRYGVPFTFRLTVSNTGGTTVWNAIPSLAISDPSLVRVDLSPASIGATIANGACATWVWQLTSVNGGADQLTGIVSGFYDTMSGTVMTTAGIGSSASATLTVSARPAGEIAVYPNPNGGDRVTCYLALSDNASEIVLDAYDSSMHRVFTGTWRNVSALDGNLVIPGLRRWAPGIYLVRASVTYVNGAARVFPVAKLRVQR